MIPVLYIIIILAIIFTIIWLCWRTASGRQSIPCPVWMKFMLDPQLSGRVSRRTQKTIDILDVRPGMNILDAGCGPGRLTMPLAEMTGPNGEATALDIQEGMLDEVKKRAKRKKLANIRFVFGGLG
ncbi:MAG: methyltransferase domain-containing protein [Methanomicrobium sp.]|nr:methyltransferase domain-containing protein [Methanomicrobium sp.]